jgi:hypothetical protein
VGSNLGMDVFHVAFLTPLLEGIFWPSVCLSVCSLFFRRLAPWELDFDYASVRLEFLIRDLEVLRLSLEPEPLYMGILHGNFLKNWHSCAQFYTSRKSLEVDPIPWFKYSHPLCVSLWSRSGGVATGPESCWLLRRD